MTPISVTLMGPFLNATGRFAQMTVLPLPSSHTYACLLFSKRTILGPSQRLFKAPVKTYYSTKATIKTLQVNAEAKTDFTHSVPSNVTPYPELKYLPPILHSVWRSFFEVIIWESDFIDYGAPARATVSFGLSNKPGWGPYNDSLWFSGEETKTLRVTFPRSQSSVVLRSYIRLLNLNWIFPTSC